MNLVMAWFTKSLSVAQWLQSPPVALSDRQRARTGLEGHGCESLGETVIENDRGARPTFKGLKMPFWYLLDCLASKGAQWQLLWYLLGY